MEALDRMLGFVLLVAGILLFVLTVHSIRRYKHALKLVSIPLFCIGVLSLDAGTGYVNQGDTSPRTVTINATNDELDRLILLFHGYNGNGRSLADILGSKLSAHGIVVAFDPSDKGYDSDEVLMAAEQAIDLHQPSKIVLYGESLGGMEVMGLLRRNPQLHAESIVFNATPSNVGDVKLGGNGLKVLNTPLLMNGGVISTGVLRINLIQGIRNAPTPESGVDEGARQEAYNTMREVTGRTAFDELRFIANFSPPRPGEFDKRADTVSYLHAPSTSDSTIETEASSADLSKAFTGTKFVDEPIPEWGPDLHSPTPERPSPLIKRLLAASQSQ